MQNGPDPRPGASRAVYRDDYGIPHLWGETVDDLAYVQGWQAAYDLAWQLEYGRLRGEGRTAELLGPTAVEWDVFARRALIVDTARRAFDRLDGRTRSWCTAYVEGVNDALPLGAAGSAEFAALDAAPRRWQAWTPLAVFAGIHVLFGTGQYKLWRAHVASTIGPELMDLLGMEGTADDGGAGGSNAYAVAGPRSPTGLPIIAGDPHRTLEVPNAYQQVRLACAEFDVVGLAFPGVPGIAHFAHAGSVAWATTNAMADYQDLYAEELGDGELGDGEPGAEEFRDEQSAPDRLRVRGPSGWEPPVAVRGERIIVRDAEPIDITAVETARGPIVLDLADGRRYSLRTPSRVELDLGFAALLPLLHAKTVHDVTRAMRDWVEPVNVLVIGDAAGRLREQVMGLVPDRTPANRVLPARATDPGAVWTGRYLHPAPIERDLVANGNDRVSGAGLGYDYASTDRVARIRRLVEAGAAFGAGQPTGQPAGPGLGRVSLDTDQPAAATVRRLLADPALAERLSPAGETIRARLSAWDGRADATSHDAALFAAWRSAFVRWLLIQPGVAPLRGESGLPSLFARWLDPIVRIGTSWSGMVAAADRLGLDLATGSAGALEHLAANPPTGDWGETHRFRPLHPLTGRPGAPELPDVGLSGDYGCVLAARSVPGLTDECSFGPVARYLWDLADREHSWWVVPLGASARSDSPHRVDQLPLWVRGETIPLVTAWPRLRLDDVQPGPAPVNGARSNR